jgi:hypothetical protein
MELPGGTVGKYDSRHLPEALLRTANKVASHILARCALPVATIPLRLERE